MGLPSCTESVGILAKRSQGAPSRPDLPRHLSPTSNSGLRGQSPGVSVQWGRGEIKKVCIHPSPAPHPDPGPPKSRFLGTRQATGLLGLARSRGGGAGGARQILGRLGARGNPGSQSSRDTCEADAAEESPSPGQARAGAQPGCLALATSCALP